MSRPARGHRHGRRYPGIFRRQKIRPAYADKIAPQQAIDQIVKPVLISPAIIVGEGDDLAFGDAEARVARGGQPLVGLAVVTN